MITRAAALCFWACLCLSACGGHKVSVPGASSSSSSSTSTSSSSSSSSSSGEPIAGASCLATEFQQPAEIGLERLLPDETFFLPTGLVFQPGDDRIYYVLQQDGVIWRVVQFDGAHSIRPLVDLRDYFNVVFQPESCYECGLYSMAFHPNFDENGYIYLSFTVGGDNSAPLESRIIRVRSDDDGSSLIEDEAGLLVHDIIYQAEQPSPVHNNGQVKFGPDGYLYVSFGDGGPGDDPLQNAQNIQLPYGSILRLTDDGDAAPGNAVEGGLPEIYAYGLRNPWHWSFDRVTGDLWAGDVGQAEIEEVNIIVNGGNYGWPCFEGLQPRNSCESDGPFVEPVWDYSHVEGQSITGGYVYRGSELPELYGVYLFGDFGSGIIWGLSPREEGSYERVRLLASGKRISAFSEDNRGELYLVDHSGGSIFRIGPVQQDPTLIPLPERLSATGCVDAANPQLPAAHLVPYDINEPFWSDNSEKQRFMALPPGGKISVREDGDFEFPVGTVLVKNFRLQGRLIETRLFLHQDNTGWSGFSYRWNEDESEALLLDDALDEDVGEQTWHYPSGAECAQCHTAAAGYSLGPEVRQLNRDFTDPYTGNTENQLDRLAGMGLFAGTLNESLRAMALPRSDDESEPLDARARSYLHSNCSHCHRPGGTSQSTMDLRYDSDMSFRRLCNAEPLQSDLDIVDARLLAPGDHARSILWNRLSMNSEYRMPPLGSNLLDTASANLIRDWIDSLAGCDTIVGGPEDVFALRNLASGTYLVQGEGGLALNATTADEGITWLVEPGQLAYWLRSSVDPELFLHGENPAPEFGRAGMDWISAQWNILPRGDAFSIRNRWRSSDYLQLNPEDGSVILAPIDSVGAGALWQFERVDATEK